MIRSAASVQPMWRSIISAERISEPGLTLSLPAYFGAVPCVASNIATVVGQVRARRDADAADLRGERVGDVVAVQVQRRDHVVLGRAQQDLLQERVGDHVLDDDRRVPVFGFLNVQPRAAVDRLGAELALPRARSPSRGSRLR